ncbi:DUF3558 domain-containing protein [Actinokineospora sp.]|uniref:DUF3558 domain-containing protein n=1 Tax=Actinokineospora sp. TaxID=1872133 RepID=UPI004037CCE2
MPGGGGSTTASGGLSTSASAGDRLPGGAPRVRKPLDSAPFQAEPCSVLTPAQLASMSVGGPGKARSRGPSGPVCDWDDNTTHIGVGGAFVIKNPQGLDTLYAQEGKGFLQLFEPLPEIEGHPAVVYGLRDGRGGGTCSVAVGLTDELTYSVAVTLGFQHPTRSDPCPVARRAAELAMATMTGGA